MTTKPHDTTHDVDTTTGELVPHRTANPNGGTPIGDQSAAVVAAGQRELTPFQAQLEQLLAPHTLDLQQWAEALFSVRDFPEADPDEQSHAMLAAILLSSTSEEALASMELDRARQLCGDEPGGTSGVLRFTGARPVKSEYEEGPACYLIVEATRLADGKQLRFTTGAAQIQAVILWHVGHQLMPFDGVLSIRREKTRRGFYPMNLTAGG